jgi:AbrB family looped-hinge helix DNA binding protein
LEVLGVAKVHGGGKIVIPRYVRQLLEIRDGDLVYFYLDERKRVVLEKSRFIVR